MAIMADNMIASSRLPDAGNRCRTAFACGRQGAVSYAFPEVIMAWFISQSLVFIVLAFVLGVIAGRFSVPPAETVEKVPAMDDELERIEGIGPAMANALRAAGIRTFEQLATSGDDAKRDAIRAAGLSFAPSLATWSRQARLLADGDERAFAELTARLIAGRDTSTPASGTPQSIAAQPAGKPRPRPRPRPADRAATADNSAAGDSTADKSTASENATDTSTAHKSTAGTSAAHKSTAGERAAASEKAATGEKAGAR
ncbi:helix-hairpin-helix domain-containing protein [Actinoplanes philippinensis]|uniref:helix-hairpin-helix domain-containing protein n=1 Tax=Actinoplanes philippinensis TaxID=35752 RepID=UPI0033D2E446